MTRFLVQKLSALMELSPLQYGEDLGELKSMRIYFPDMGAAALARRDWKMGYCFSRFSLRRLSCKKPTKYLLYPEQI